MRPALLSVSVGACAQSSITLFGLLDEELNFTYNAGGSKAYQMTSNDLVTNRWGLKGTEDFGAVQTINRL